METCEHGNSKAECEWCEDEDREPDAIDKIDRQITRVFLIVLGIGAVALIAWSVYWLR